MLHIYITSIYQYQYLNQHCLFEAEGVVVGVRLKRSDDAVDGSAVVVLEKGLHRVPRSVGAFGAVPRRAGVSCEVVREAAAPAAQVMATKLLLLVAGMGSNFLAVVVVWVKGYI